MPTALPEPGGRVRLRRGAAEPLEREELRGATRRHRLRYVSGALSQNVKPRKMCYSNVKQKLVFIQSEMY